jgi:hypothetical protein
VLDVPFERGDTVDRREPRPRLDDALVERRPVLAAQAGRGVEDRDRAVGPAYR